MAIELKSGIITGVLAGRSLSCTTIPALPGWTPAAGRYQILPPTEDAILGLVAIALPVSDVGGGIELLVHGGQFEVFDKDHKGHSAVHQNLNGIPPGTPAATRGFLLSGRPLLGRNCLVIGSRFADLMDALRNSGGAMVNVG